MTMSASEKYQLSRNDTDMLRIVASVMVVIVHCVHYWVEGFYASRDFGSLGFWATCIDQFTRFTVPLFFFLSGFALTSQYQANPKSLGEYYRTRLPKILTPFLLWSALTSLRHVDFFSDLPWRAAPLSAGLQFLKFLFLDGFDYQFYFLIVIFQFYLVFPFLLRLSRSAWTLGVVFLIHLAFMSPIETYLGLLGWRLPGLHSHLLIFYEFYCVAGMYAAWHRDFLADLLRRWSARQVFGFWLASLGLMLVEYWVNIQNGKGLYDSDHFNRWSVVVYCLTCMLLFMKGKTWMMRHLRPDSHWRFLYTGVAPYTFFIYLVHTHLLRLVELVFYESSVWDFVSRILMVVGGSYAIAWALQWLLEDFPAFRFALGMPKAPLRWDDLPGVSFLRSRWPQPNRGKTVSLETKTARN